MKPRSGERIFRRSRGSSRARHEDHGLQPWLHSFAAPRLGISTAAPLVSRSPVAKAAIGTLTTLAIGNRSSSLKPASAIVLPLESNNIAETPGLTALPNRFSQTRKSRDVSRSFEV